MEITFQQGALTRTEAVSALKSLGFGKSAAYEALSDDGQFANWLQVAPDGLIFWKSEAELMSGTVNPGCFRRNLPERNGFPG